MNAITLINNEYLLLLHCYDRATISQFKSSSGCSIPSVENNEYNGHIVLTTALLNCFMTQSLHHPCNQTLRNDRIVYTMHT